MDNRARDMRMNFSRHLLICAGFCAIALTAESAAWRVAPAPPASWQRDRVADLSAHRKAVMSQIGPNGILVLMAAEPRNYAGDTDWPFRQENNFYYLTGISQAGAALVLIPGGEHIHEVLFLPPSDPAQEDWTGHLLTPEEGRATSGIADVWDARQFPAFLAALIPLAASAFSVPEAAGHKAASQVPPLPVDLAHEFAKVTRQTEAREAQLYLLTHGSNRAEYRREQELEARLDSAFPGFTIKDATEVLAKLRAVKSPRELDIVQQAADISAEGFERAFALAVPGTGEYEIQAQFELTFVRRNAHWGYPPIVGAGKNATTLHYESNRDRMAAGDLLLIDAGAEFDGYSADVTRTIPVSGKFTPEQAAIYRIVWAAQHAAIAAARPGETYSGRDSKLRAAAVKALSEGLFKLGLITDPESTQYMTWLNHGISHSIGLNVHDPDSHELAPGMLITVEPGLYIRPDALDRLPKTAENARFTAAVRPAFEKYKGIGVRIEDDILITADGAKVITADIPSRLEDVEAAIAEARQAIRTTPLP